MTHILAIDLLSHHGVSKTVRVLLQRSTETQKALEKRALLENVEIRLINMPALGANNHRASLHATSIITETHTVLGSYDLVNLARAGNFEVVTVTPTQEESVILFDEMWEHDLVMMNQVERTYKELYYAAPERSKRKTGNDALNVEIAARKRAKAAGAASS